MVTAAAACFCLLYLALHRSAISDVALYRILSDSKVPVFLVRNKIDIAMQSRMDRADVDERSPIAQVQQMQLQLRQDIAEYCLDNVKSRSPVPRYLVSARYMMYPHRNVYCLPAIQFDELKLVADVSAAASRRA